MENKKRDYTIDGLRAIGLFAIILAHVGPPKLIFQIRNFDVILMVLLSGSVFSMSAKTQINYFKYLTKRIFRLLAPTWLFLAFFFLFYAIISHLNQSPFPYSLHTIFSSFFLGEGIGYVWIIRVFILVAMILPFLYKYYTKTNNRNFLILLISLYFVYELLYYLYPHFQLSSIENINQLFQKIIFYALPFGVVAGLGLYSKELGKKSLLNLTLFFASIFIFIFVVYYLSSQQVTATQAYKYPPRLYYFSYGLFISFGLYWLSKFDMVKNFLSNNFLRFVGSSSMWIYLWHIFYLSIWKSFGINFPISYLTYLAEFITISAISIFTAFIQQMIINKLTQLKSKQPVLSQDHLKVSKS